VDGVLADRVIDDAAQRLDEPAIGLVLAHRLPIGALGEVDYAFCTSATLRTGLERLARFYKHATERVELALECAGQEAALVYRSASNEGYSRHWREFAVAAAARRIRQTLGRQIRFREVTFAHAAPASTLPHLTFFRCPVRFGDDADRLSFAAALLSKPLLTASRALADLLDARIRAREPRRGLPSQNAFLARVHGILCTLLDGGDVPLASAAHQLSMSPRTLQRELRRAGTSHRAMLDGARRELALAWLEASTLPLADVSSRLGFSDTRAFFRAFQRWTGTSPAAMRRKARILGTQRAKT
jgi:AraC-like DNA-binding protein